MTPKHRIVLVLSLCLLLFINISCQRTNKTQQSLQADMTNNLDSSLSTSNSDSDINEWLIPLISEYLQDDSSTTPPIVTYELLVNKSGGGTVSGTNISCGTDCSYTYNSGTSVTLTATPASGYNFTGWSGACTGTGGCTIAMTSNRSVTANFLALTPQIEAAINERLSIPLLAYGTDPLDITIDYGYKVVEVQRTATELIFDLRFDDAITLNNDNSDEVEIVVRLSTGAIVGSQRYKLSSIFSDAEVIVSLEGLTPTQFDSEIAGTGYSRISYDATTNKAVVNIGSNTSAEALQDLYIIISNASPQPSTALQTQSLAGSIRALAGPNYAYKPDGRGVRALDPSCDVRGDLLAYSQDDNWDAITNLNSLINIDEAHAAGYMGNNITVVLLDSGIDADDDFDCPETPQKEMHGTHIRDIVQTLAPNVNIVSKKVFNSTGTASIDNLINTNDLLRALKEIEQDYLIAGDKVILNMSFSSPVHSQHGHDLMLWGTLADLYDFYGDQLLIVAAAGNHGLDDEFKTDIFYPAGFSRNFTTYQQSVVLNIPAIPNVISVGSAGLKNGQTEVASYNPDNTSVDLLGYGMNLCSSDVNATTCIGNHLVGSSFSVPIVSALAAITWNRCEQKASTDIYGVLIAQSVDVGSSTAKLTAYDSSISCNGNPIVPAPTILSIDTSSQHTCQLRGDLQIYCWGDGYRIGNSNTNSNPVPQAITNPQEVPSWKQLASGRASCALSNNDEIYCWGYGSTGLIGNGSNASSFIPTAVQKPSEVSYWQQVSSSDTNVCAIADTNQTYCWGAGLEGQLGYGGYTNQNIPTQVFNPTNVTSWKQISAGHQFTCGISNDDQIYCWGYNQYGGLGTGDLIHHATPVQIVNPMNVTKWKYVSTSHSGKHSCGISNNDQIYCWGNNQFGQLGRGSSNGPQNPTPGFYLAKQVINPMNVLSWQQVSAGGSNNTCALGSDDQIYCWGSQGRGHLGNGTNQHSNVPTPILNPFTNMSWKFTNMASDTGCGIDNNDVAYCWGGNQSGELGIGNYFDQPTPVAVLTP